MMAVSFPGMNQNFFKPITPKQIVKVILIVLAVVAVGVALYFVYADRNEFLDNRIIDDLVGDSEANARYVLEESDLQVVVEYEKHDGVEGIVLRTRPSAGYSVPIGSTVYVTVSQHRVVPACLNLNYATAETLLAQQGIYNYEFEYQKSDQPKGSVIGVSPSENSVVTQNDRLVITVATPYVVPRLLGLLLEPALYAISEAGYVSEVEYREDANHSPGTVFECNYAEGAEVISGSVVHIVIAVAPTPVEPIEDEQTPNE